MFISAGWVIIVPITDVVKMTLSAADISVEPIIGTPLTYTQHIHQVLHKSTRGSITCMTLNNKRMKQDHHMSEFHLCTTLTLNTDIVVTITFLL